MPTLAEQFNIKCPDKIDFTQIVIIAEPSHELRLILSHHIQKLGFKNTVVCRDAIEVSDYLKQPERAKKVALIISVDNLEGLSGVELLAEIRDNPNMSRPPFALAITNPNKDKIMLAMEAGADELLVKPYALKDIFPKMQSTFRKFHNPGNPEKVYEYAKSLLVQKEYELAEAVFTAIGEETQSSARPWVGLAESLYRKGDHKGALAALDEAEKRNPSFVHTFCTRGRFFMELKREDEAIAQYRKAIELSPLNPVRYADVAVPLFALKRYKDGVDILAGALAKEVRFPSIHRYLSEGYFALKDFKNALKHIRSALQTDPENVVYLNQLGICLKENNEIEEAVKVYNSVIKLDNENKAALFNKALILQSTGQTDEACKLLKRILAKSPNFKPAAIKLAEWDKAAA
jgi:tetratricopeptide (TPR) repeat protein